MKIQITEGCGHRGAVLAPGTIIDCDAQDFLDLLQSGRAVAVNAGDHAKALDAANAAAVRAEKHGAAGAWLRR